MGRYIFRIKGLPKDSEYNAMPFGRQMGYMDAIKAFKADTKSIHFSAKRKTTKAGFAEFKRLYKPSEWFLVDRDGPLYHDDSFEVWFRSNDETSKEVES